MKQPVSICLFLLALFASLPISAAASQTETRDDKPDENQTAPPTVGETSSSSSVEAVLGLRRIFGFNLIDQGSFDEAEPRFVANVSESREFFGPTDPRSLLAQIDLANLYMIQGRMAEAGVLLDELSTQSRATLSEDHPVSIDILHNQATWFAESGQFVESERLFRDLVSRNERVYGADSLETLDAVNDFGILSERQGKYSLAERLHQRALEGRARQLGPTAPHTLDSINNLALLYDLMGRYEEAEPLLINLLAETINTQGEETLGAIAAMNNLGAFYLGIGRFGDAEKFYDRSLELREMLLGPDHPQTLESKINQGELYYNQGRFEEAEVLLEATLSKTSEKLGTKHPTVLSATVYLAEVIRAQGRLQDAEPFYRTAVSSQSATLGQLHPSTLVSSKGLATLLRDQRKFAEADQIFEQVLDALNGSVGSGHQSSLGTLAELAASARLQGDLERARNLSFRALALGSQSLPEQHPLLAQINFEIAQLLEEQDNRSRANYFYKRTINLLQGLRQNMTSSPSTTHRAFLEKWSAAYLKAQSSFVADGRFAEAEQIGRMFKETEYLSFVRGNTVSQLDQSIDLTPSESQWSDQLDGWMASPNRLAARIETLQGQQASGTLTETELAEISQLQAAYDVSYSDFRDKLTIWLSEVEGIESDLIQSEAYALNAASAERLQANIAKIGDNVAVLQAVAFDDGLHLFLTTGSAFFHTEIAVERGELFAAIFAARIVIDEAKYVDDLASNERDQELKGALGKLYDWLIRPVEAELSASGTEVLMLNLQGQIRYVPFAALWTGRNWLIEDYQLTLYTPAAQTLFETPQTVSTGIAFGLSNATTGFSPLSGVEQELEWIVGTEQEAGAISGEFMLNERFTRTALEAALVRPMPVLHIASHFSINPGNESSSFLVLGDGSHLTLSEINRSSRMRFNGIELLTLSACETAVGGDGTGLEIEGLGALAQNKGAASVLATLWQVADDSTPRFMQAFYSNIALGSMSKAAALQLAQREMIESEGDQDPFYWAPFILMGNWK